VGQVEEFGKQSFPCGGYSLKRTFSHRGWSLLLRELGGALLVWLVYNVLL
jgi:hypothetical protein